MTITPLEAQAVARALDNYLPELRYELARMKSERERHELVEFEEMLTNLRSRLSIDEKTTYV